ncbi:MAG: TetR/AcrR family transcriptional regulator [Candidatus Thorarchaeota archaeon]
MTGESKKFRRDKRSKIDSVVQATVALIEEKGYSGFSVNEIPERTNLSIGTVYRYFPRGKSDILREIIARNNQALVEMIFLDDVKEENFFDFWRRVIFSYLRGHREGLFSLAALEYSYGSDSEFKEVLGSIAMEFFKRLVSQLIKLQTFTTLSERDLFERVTLVFGFIGLLVKSHVKRPFFKSDERLVEYLMDISKLTFETKL